MLIHVFSDIIDSCDLVFFPVNDNADHSSTGGTHWSLLVWNRVESEFTMLDSGNRSNERPSLQVAQKAAHLVCPYTKFKVNAVLNT